MKRRHKLLTKALLKKLPPLYSGEDTPASERKIPVKFFSPYTGWRWYVLEYDPADKLFFGYVSGMEKEYGYFSFDELDQAVVKGIVPAVERDLQWNSDTILQDVLDEKVY